MSSPKLIADRYLALWNETDDQQRRDMLAEQWTPDARYVDPMMAGTGHDGIATMIQNARMQFAGHGFTLVGAPDGHGDRVRFSWSLAPVGGAAIAAGTDIVRLDSEGRVADVVGFLDGVET
ncbi:MAG: nuclear transport factor 2 family protein [Pseudomonadota bacterium]|uniref:nuclear transport factor 2 family protein n=1 Tax=Sphingomonas sp. ERG5 TaxID=1381597 RepID=UPI00054C3A79|nr:nuclear transport factor 2 family protein [Sphingomonas sp. ERG5]